jgi:hypothetical protein
MEEAGKGAPSLVIISLCLEGGGAERAGVAHVLVGGEDVLPQVPLLLRLKAALVAHEPAAHKDPGSGQGVEDKWKKFQLKKNRIHHIFSPLPASMIILTRSKGNYDLLYTFQ